MRLQPEIGRRIAVAREEAGVSQHDLAKAAGVPLRNLAEIESGTRGIHVKEIISLIDATGKDLGFFTDPNRLVGEGKWTFKVSEGAT